MILKKRLLRRRLLVELLLEQAMIGFGAVGADVGVNADQGSATIFYRR